jgi:hypothetical protein
VNKLSLLASVLLTTTTLTVGRAQTQAVTAFTYQDLRGDYERTKGWEFTVDQTLTVTHLGIWDQSPVTGGWHRLYLWTASGQTLVWRNITLPSGGSGGPEWRRVEASAVLQPGNTYVVAYIPESIELMAQNIASLQTDPLVNWVAWRHEDHASFPTSRSTDPRSGYIGASFRFNGPDPVPEPPTVQLPVLLALGAVAAWRWRGRR